MRNCHWEILLGQFNIIFKKNVSLLLRIISYNRPFPSSPQSLFQSESSAGSYMIVLNIGIPLNSQLWNVEINVLRRTRSRQAIAFAWVVSLLNCSVELGVLCHQIGVGVLIIFILRVSFARSQYFSCVYLYNQFSRAFRECLLGS